MVENPQLLAKKDLKDGFIAALNKVNAGEAPRSNNERPSSQFILCLSACGVESMCVTVSACMCA
eukprot:10989113-Lingulodinium_polyedra.AAC.1